MDTKICIKCFVVKPLSEFRIKRNDCIACERAYKRAYQSNQRIINPEKIKSIKRASYTKHKQEILKKKKDTYNKEKPKILQRVAEYRNKNREKINAWFREYYKSQNEKRVAKDKAYVENNREKIAERKKQYRESHRAEIRQRNRARKAAIKYSKSDYTQKDWEYCVSYWQGSCAICGRQAQTGVIIAADHWQPLNRGGLTHKKNILPLCHGVNGCNNQKRDKDPVKWITSKLGNNAGQKLSEIEAYFSSL